MKKKRRRAKKKNRVSAEEFERIFDEGKENILDYCDLTKMRVKPGIKKVAKRKRAKN